MKNSDDKINRDEQSAVDTEKAKSVKGDADGLFAPLTGDTVDNEKVEKAPEKRKESIMDGEDSKESSGNSFAGELVSLSIKSVAVALSLIILLTCILAVAMPLTSMRIFNKLGMYERAVDFGERYISRELDDFGADKVDVKGNFAKLSQTPKLTNDDFVEALYVCSNLSMKLMDESYKSGDSRLVKYYAERLEKYTRMYLSLNNVASVNNSKSAYNIAAMPLIAMRPVVYSYGHTVRRMNFRARAYLGKTAAMVYNSRRNGDVMTELGTLSQSFYGYNIESFGRDTLMSTLDDYVDYIGQIGEYLDVEFIRAGVENDLSKRKKVYVKQLEEWREYPVLSDNFIINSYSNYLSGTEFSLLISRTDGFSFIYNQLKRINVYAQAAVDFMPSDNNNNKLDEQLHQLYWLQEFSTVMRKLWYMEKLLYQNQVKFGQSMNAIAEDYNAWQERTYVDFGTPTEGVKPKRQLWDVYNIKLQEYIAQYQV
ncbi:MAG: hypothetical protein J1G01_03980 [Clostridiales bacterium]|nr:hypothetical protein [Clostridiales bacterium]